MRRRFLSKQPSAAEMPPPDRNDLSRRKAEALAPIELVTPLAPIASRSARGIAEPPVERPPGPAPRIYTRPSQFSDAPRSGTRAAWSRYGRVAAATLFLLLTGTSLPLPSADLVTRMVVSLTALSTETTITRAEIPKPREPSATAIGNAAAPSRRNVVDLANVAGRSMSALTARFDDAATSTAAAPVSVTEIPRPIEVHSRPAHVAGIPVPVPVEITARAARTASASAPAAGALPLARARGTIVVTTGALLLTSNQLDGTTPPFPSLSLPNSSAQPQLPRTVARYPANGLARAQPAWPSAWRQAQGPRTASASLAGIRDLMMVGQ